MTLVVKQKSAADAAVIKDGSRVSHNKTQGVNMTPKNLLLALVLSVASMATSAQMVDMNPSTIIAKYGKPDVVKSSENERPKPFFITRMMEYKKAGVRVTLLANDKQPPYVNWKLMGYQDIKTTNVIKLEEFESRIKAAK